MSWLYVKNPARWTGSKETKKAWRTKNKKSDNAQIRKAAKYRKNPKWCLDCKVVVRFMRHARVHMELGHRLA